LPPLPLSYYMWLLIMLFIPGIWICGRTARALGIDDHPAIVYDEIVGYLVTMTMAPSGWQWLAAGFLLFRVFDIWKPWPIRWLDRSVKGGLGIMLDDLVAGLLALSTLQLTSYLINLPFNVLDT
jgi:phosphatidylglycerophosphatase A